MIFLPATNRKLEKEQRYIQKYGKVPPDVKTNLDRSAYYDKIDDELIKLRAQPPSNEKLGIASGDWVTINRNYAKEHGKGGFHYSTATTK